MFFELRPLLFQGHFCRNKVRRTPSKMLTRIFIPELTVFMQNGQNTTCTYFNSIDRIFKAPRQELSISIYRM